MAEPTSNWGCPLRFSHLYTFQKSYTMHYSANEKNMQFIHIMPFKSIFFKNFLVIDFTGYTYLKLSFDMTLHNPSNNFVTWPSMYITWNMVERKKWKQMIRPAIRNVFDSQSTRKSRATWRKKRISLSGSGSS